jgi:hypothetical protein
MKPGTTQFPVSDVMQEIEKQAAQAGVNPDWAKAIFVAENSHDGILRRTVVDGAARSPKGARGVMQTMETTENLLKRAGFLPAAWQYNPADLSGQVQAGIAAIREKSSRLKDPSDLYELAAMYNGGTESWQNYRAGLIDKLPAETRQYFDKLRVATSSGRSRMSPEDIKFIGGVMAPAPAAPPGGRTTTSSTTVRSTAFDPEFLTGALSAGYELVKSGGGIDTAINSINAAASARTAAEQAQLTAIQQRAQAEGALAAADSAVTASAAARRNNILRIANLQPETVGNAAEAAMQAVIAGTSELETLGSEIDKRQAVGLFDNPFQWLINQTRLPGMIGQYNAKAMEQNRKIEAAKNLQSLAATQITLSQGVDADLITRQGAAKAAEAAARAQEQLTQVQQAIAGNAVRDANQAVVMAGQKFKTITDMAQLTKEVRSENQGATEQQINKLAQERQLESVNKFLKMVGSTTQYDVVTFKMLPAKTREQLLEVAGTGKMGATLYDTLMNVQNLGNSRTLAAEGDAAAVAWMQGVLGEANKIMTTELKIARDIAFRTGKPVKEEEFFKQAVDKLQAQFNAETLDMRTASELNPYKISYAALLKDPIAAKNPVGQFLSQYGPTSAEPLFNKVDEKFILDKMVADVGAGKLRSGQAAAAISEFYRLGTKQQEKITRYPLMGLPGPANGYTVVIPASGFFDKPMVGGTVDLTNSAAVEEYIIKNVASQRPRGLINTNPRPGLSEVVAP